LILNHLPALSVNDWVVSRNHESFLNGQVHGRNQVLCGLLENSDKTSAILALFRIASIEAKKENPTSLMAARLQAYAEGLRHALNILENLGDALSTYDNIINASIKVPLTQKDIEHPDSIVYTHK